MSLTGDKNRCLFGQFFLPAIDETCHENWEHFPEIRTSKVQSVVVSSSNPWNWPISHCGLDIRDSITIQIRVPYVGL